MDPMTRRIGAHDRRPQQHVRRATRWAQGQLIADPDHALMAARRSATHRNIEGTMPGRVDCRHQRVGTLAPSARLPVYSVTVVVWPAPAMMGLTWSTPMSALAAAGATSAAPSSETLKSVRIPVIRPEPALWSAAAR